MQERQRQVLERVASGEISPEEALALLGQPPATTPRTPTDSAVTRLVIEADLGAVAVVADATVDDAVVIGAFELRRTGDQLRVTGPKDRSILSDGRLLPRRGRRHALRIRMRPDLALSVKLGAGTVYAEGLQGASDIAVDLGTVTLEGTAAPFDVHVASGSVSISGVVTAGQSRIDCDLGAVSVRLGRPSNVRVTAATDAGRITLPGDRHGPSIVFGTQAEATVGRGDAHLDIRTAAGSISVTVDK